MCGPAQTSVCLAQDGLEIHAWKKVCTHSIVCMQDQVNVMVHCAIHSDRCWHATLCMYIYTNRILYIIILYILYI